MKTIPDIVESFVRNASPEEMLAELRDADPNDVFGSIQTSVLDSQPRASCIEYQTEVFMAEQFVSAMAFEQTIPLDRCDTGAADHQDLALAA